MKSIQESMLRAIAGFGLLLISLPSPSYAGREGNGGFAYPTAKRLLQTASARLEADLLGRPGNDFGRIEGRKADLVRAIHFENLDLRPDERRLRGSRPLQMDYDVSAWKLTVLEPFFASYELVTPENWSVFERRVEKVLLHEAAHLFGIDEAEADSFAEALVADRDAVYEDFHLYELGGGVSIVNGKAAYDRRYAVNVAVNSGTRRVKCLITYDVERGSERFERWVEVSLGAGHKTVADAFLEMGDERLLQGATIDLGAGGDYVRRWGGPAADLMPSEKLYSNADATSDSYSCEYVN